MWNAEQAESIANRVSKDIIVFQPEVIGVSACEGLLLSCRVTVDKRHNN